MPEIETIPWRRNASASDPVERQLDADRDGSRTTYPATWMPADSSSSSFQPVLPICGAVCTTIWRW